MKLSGLLIALVALSLVLGPVMMLRPNPAQKRKEQLRSLARAKGIHFSMRNLPRQADENSSPEAIPVYFFAPKKQQNAGNWLLMRTNYQHEIHLFGWWAWQGELRPTASEMAVLNQFLPLLPESVKAVSGGGQGVSVYWTEAGGEAVLHKIIPLLESLNSPVPE